MSDLNQLDGTSEAQSCYKCNTLPEDILMLACGHDLCLSCAAERLASESKRKPATGIVCEFCSEKTQLDADSIFELEKITQNVEMKQRRDGRDVREGREGRDVRESNARIYRATEEEDVRKTEKYSKYERAARNQKRDYLNAGVENKAVSLTQPTSYKAPSFTVPTSSSALARKNCQQHPEEQILYYCFDCNCECICPECVIHGKHKNHEVKTIKKSQPLIKSRLEHFLQNIDTNVDSLITKRNEFEAHIKELVSENGLNKKQVQKAFAELRSRLNAKERETLAKCNKALETTLEAYEKGITDILKKVEDIKSSSQTIGDVLKKEEVVMLNFYAKKHQDFEQLIEKVDTSALDLASSDKLLHHDPATKALVLIVEELDKLDIDSTVRYESKYDEKDGRVSVDQDESDYSRYKHGKEEEKPSRDYMRRY